MSIGVAVLGCLFATVDARATGPTRTVSVVKFSEGNVTFTGSNDSHRLNIWDSSLDAAERSWRFDTAAPETRQEADFSADQWLQQADGMLATHMADSEDPDRSQLRAATLSVMGIVFGIPELDLLATSLKYSVETAIGALDEAQAAERTYREARRSNIQKVKAKQIGWQAAAAEAQRAQTAFTQAVEVADARFDVAEGLVKENKRALQRAAENHSGGTQAIVRTFIRRMGEAIDAAVARGKGGPLLLAAAVGSTALLATASRSSAAPITTDSWVVIRDVNRNPIHAVKPCRQVVRGSGGTETILGDTVACPVPADAGLSVALGAGDDELKLRLAPGTNPFKSVVIEGGAGDDTIYGSSLGEQLIGDSSDWIAPVPSGNDTIFGNGGDDDIVGDNNSWTALTSPTSGTGNDRLFGGQGQDTIDGGPGDDLVAGGPGDDLARLWGAGLKGGRGADTIHGGSGVDSMDGGSGADAILAKESDFLKVSGDPSQGYQRDEVDTLVDCGGRTAPAVTEFYTASPGEYPVSCHKAPRYVPTAADLLRATPTGGRWSWFD